MSEPTPRAGAEQEIQRLRAELDAARAALGEFASVVSHDLRAPVRHVLAYGELLREELGGQLAGERAQFLDTITQAAQLMGRQIDGLKEWAQIDRVALQPSVVHSAALVAEARAQLAAQMENRSVDWQFQDGLPAVRGDAALLRQLFVHLLSNALKFSRPRLTAVIQVGWAPAADGQVALFVRDNGVGYNPAQQDQLFHVFKRLHGTSQFEGLGLGLALAHKIVARHGGSIAIEGAPDAGCRVTVMLPRAAQDTPNKERIVKISK
jgi:light-regulated signal transduction histidine kinase (bacteriophytochrome)